jgi:hypothetical protein
MRVLLSQWIGRTLDGCKPLLRGLLLNIKLEASGFPICKLLILNAFFGALRIIIIESNQ